MNAKPINVLLVVLLGVTLLVGCSTSAVPQPEGEVGVSPHPGEAEIEITLYFAGTEAMYVVPEVRKIVRQEDETLPDLVIEELIKGPESEELGRTIPEGTKLLSVDEDGSKIRIRDGVAYVNFSKEIQTKHWGGSTGELMTTASIVNSLTELDGIEKVQILVEGKVEESIWGHGYTGEPIERMEEAIEK